MPLARESELRIAVVVNSASFKCQTHRCWEGLYTFLLFSESPFSLQLYPQHLKLKGTGQYRSEIAL